MEIGENTNFDNLSRLIKNSLRDDFIDYIANDGKHYKRDLTVIAQRFDAQKVCINEQTKCIKKMTTLLKVEQEKTLHLENAISYNSKLIQELCREIILLKKD